MEVWRAGRIEEETFSGFTITLPFAILDVCQCCVNTHFNGIEKPYLIHDTSAKKSSRTRRPSAADPGSLPWSQRNSLKFNYCHF